MKKAQFNKKQCGTIKMNVLVPAVGIIGVLVFGGLLIWSVANNSGAAQIAVFGVLLLVSVMMTLTVNQRIDYTPLGFSYRDMFRITHKYEYSQVRKIKYDKDSWIKVGHRVIFIDSMALNGRKFVRIAMQYASSAEVKKEKLFNGNVKQPGEFIFVWVLFFVLIIGFYVWGLYGTRKILPDELSVCSGTIAEYDFGASDGEKRLTMRLDFGDATFETEDLDDDFRYDDFKKDAAAKKEFRLYYRAKGGEAKIYRLSCGDEVYVTPDKINRELAETRRVFTGVVLFFVTIWAIFVAVSVRVMSNPDKYPEWLIRLFVKPRYIKKKR